MEFTDFFEDTNRTNEILLNIYRQFVLYDQSFFFLALQPSLYIVRGQCACLAMCKRIGPLGGYAVRILQQYSHSSKV